MCNVDIQKMSGHVGKQRTGTIIIYYSIVAVAMVLNGCGNVAVVSDNGGSGGIRGSDSGSDIVVHTSGSANGCDNKVVVVVTVIMSDSGGSSGGSRWNTIDSASVSFSVFGR